MKIPQVKDAVRYTGLYVVDFGDHSGTGFTADEVSELLESERFKDIKVYKIYRAEPDGTMELKGVPSGIFQLETGMLFYSDIQAAGEKDFNRLVNTAVKTVPPARAKVELAKYSGSLFATALIYPAEYNDEFSQWLIDADYKTAGDVEGGIEPVKRYYEANAEILKRQQLFGKVASESRSGKELLLKAKSALQR